MYLGIAVVLILLWGFGYFVRPMGGSAVHLLLVIGLVAVIWHFMKGRSAPRA